MALFRRGDATSRHSRRARMCWRESKEKGITLAHFSEGQNSRCLLGSVENRKEDSRSEDWFAKSKVKSGRSTGFYSPPGPGSVSLMSESIPGDTNVPKCVTTCKYICVFDTAVLMSHHDQLHAQTLRLIRSLSVQPRGLIVLTTCDIDSFVETKTMETDPMRQATPEDRGSTDPAT